MSLYVGNNKISAFGGIPVIKKLETSDATATPDKLLEGETAYGADGKIDGTIPVKTAQTYTPGTESQIISAGQYLGGDQVIESIPAEYKNTSDATIEPYEVMNGEIAYGEDGQVVGTAPFKFVEVAEGNINYKVLESVILSADNCETRKLYVKNNEILLEGVSSSGAYVWEKHCMSSAITETEEVGYYFITKRNSFTPYAELEYGNTEPVYDADNGTWVMPDSTIGFIGTGVGFNIPNIDTATYFRLTSEPNIWYLITDYTSKEYDDSSSTYLTYSTKYEAPLESCGYVVDDDSAKYPEAEWQDGCYYDKVGLAEEVTW